MDWPPARPARQVDIDVVTLACERDAVVLMRMLDSLLRHLGEPASLTVVSDGSLQQDASAAVRRLFERTRILDFDRDVRPDVRHPVIRRFCDTHVWGKKLALYARPLDGRPRLVLDCDIEFFAGAYRLMELAAKRDPRPMYMAHDRRAGRDETYDRRLTEGLTVLPRVNAGLSLLRADIDWTSALERLERAVEDPTFLTEQTAFAVAMTIADGQALPPEHFVLSWSDAGYPWDRLVTDDTALRHYASAASRWKLLLRGGARGFKSLPRALLAAATSR